MGVKEALASIVITPTGLATATAAGIDIAGELASLQLRCDEISSTINSLTTGVLVPSRAEAANIATLAAQVANVSAAAAANPVKFGWRSDPASTVYPQELAFLGGPPDYITAYATTGGAYTWANYITGAQNQFVEYAGIPIPLRWAVPLTQTGTTLAAVAAGAGDATFVTLAQIISMGALPGQAQIWVRLGWEMNGNWFPWGAVAGNTAADYVSAYNRAAAIFAGVDPRFRFCWCPNAGGSSGSPSAAAFYPSDNYVDAVGCDIYATSATDSADPWTSWNTYSLINTGFVGLNTIAAIASAHNHPITVEEYGQDTDSMEYWIASFMAWARTNQILAHSYFDKLGWVISDNSKPSNAAEFIRQLTPVVTVTSPASYLASQAAITYLPLCASKPQCTFSFVGSVPPGFSITNNNCLVVARSAALGANKLTVRAMDERGNSGILAMTVNVQSAALSAWGMAQLSPNLRGWWDISNVGSLTQSGGFITGAIADLTGNGFTMTKAGTSVPYSATGHNSLPAITLNGGGWIEVTNAATLINNTVPQSFVGVFAGASNLSAGFYAAYGAGDTAGDITFNWQSANGVLKLYAGGAGTAAQTGIALTSLDYVTQYQIMPAGSGFNSGRCIAYLRHNGVAQPTMSINPFTNTVNRFIFGGQPAAAGAFTNGWRGFMSEFAVVNNITPSQQVLLDGYLAWKWSLQAQLPATHPCANAAPLAV